MSSEEEKDKRAEAEIEIWKIKKLVKNLQAARG
jgi:peptide chain release factor subunit 1